MVVIITSQLFVCCIELNMSFAAGAFSTTGGDGRRRLFTKAKEKTDGKDGKADNKDVNGQASIANLMFHAMASAGMSPSGGEKKEHAKDHHHDQQFHQEGNEIIDG
jgi:hypothetical protein